MSSQISIFISRFFPSSNNINNILKYSASKINILTWLFEMDCEERMKTFSLVNYDICHNIIKMYDKFSSCNKIKFKINIKDKKPIINHRDFGNDYYALSENYRLNQKLLLKEIRFYKIYKTNDAITLSSQILMNPKIFCEVFDELSNNNFLNEICPVVFDQKQGFYTCTSPKWFNEKEYYNISQLIIGYFENILNIKYLLSKKKKTDFNDALNMFYNKKNLVLDLIKTSQHNEKLSDMIDLKKIISDVINDRVLINDEERRLASKRFILGIYQPFRLFEPPPVEYNSNHFFYKYKELLMEKSGELLNTLLYFSFEGESMIDKSIKEKIFEELYLYAEKKRVENVLMEITEKGFLTQNKKKKPNKKKKKKNKKNEDTNGEEENKINNNIIPKNENNINSINIINTQESDNIKEKNSKNKEENNENNISTISNSSNNNNKECININEILEIKNEIINEEEKNNNLITPHIKDSPDKNSIRNNDSKEDIFIDKNEHFGEIKNNSMDSPEIKKSNSIEINNINNNDKISESEDEKEDIKEDKKEDNEENIISNENKIEISKNHNNIIINTKPKKKRKKKPKKKNHKLTPQELENIYNNFYNENNNIIKGTQNKISHQNSNQIQPFNKNLLKDKNELLHNLILNFEKQINKKIISLHEIKYNSIVLLCQKIKDHFKCGLSIFIYGSYSTGMQLEESDIDISVELIPSNTNNTNYNENNNNKNVKNNIGQKTIPELINELNEYLSNFPEFKNLFPIVNTKIPILKMKIEQNNIETKIDLTFNLKNTKTTINYYNNAIKRYPQIKPLTLLIKHLIKKNKLASVFDGGFSSHSIFIMVASNIRVLLKNKSSLNLGDLLNGFLHFYGKVFNYTNTAIDLTSKNEPYIITQEFSKVPVFIDPITKINVSKSSFLHQELKKLFSDTYDKLVQGEDNLNKTFEDIFF